MNADLVKTDNLVFADKGRRAVTTSLVVAEKFNKEHFHVLRDIRQLGCSESFTESNFGFSEYKDSTGRSLPMCIMTRDGFVILAMGFTGEKAMQWKEQYIDAFNRMESVLRRRGNEISSNEAMLRMMRIEDKLDRILGGGNITGPLTLFLSERCDTFPKQKTSKADVYEAYVAFSEDRGLTPFLGYNQFFKELYAHTYGLKPCVMRGQRAIKGIALRKGGQQ